MLLPVLLVGIIVALPLSLLQWVLVERYCRYMNRVLPTQELKSWAAVHALPTVEVLLPIRGSEPSLMRNLKAILEQDYVSFRLHVILDSPEDSAFEAVQKLVDEGHPVVVHLLEFSTNKAGLKPLGLSQVCEKLLQDESEDSVFAFTDADTLHAQSWLLRLVWGLRTLSPDGAVTGNRWYWQRVADSTVGSRVRSLWNVASLPQMHQYRVAWGGSWAIGGRALSNSGLLDAWKVSLFEDTMVKGQIAPELLETVPGLYSVSDDSLDLKGARRWVHRQLLDLRLYHKCFDVVAGHAMLTLQATVFTVIVVALFFIYRGFDIAIGVLLAVLFHLSNVAIWWRLKQTGNHCLNVLRLTPESLGIQLERDGFWASLQALVITQILYPRAILLVLMTRKVSWRGIRYRITKGQVERLNYKVHDQ